MIIAIYSLGKEDVAWRLTQKYRIKRYLGVTSIELNVKWLAYAIYVVGQRQISTF